MPATRSFTGRTRKRKTNRIVRLADAAARVIISIGGIGTIVAVSTVFLFLLWVVWPLFLPAKVMPKGTVALAGAPPLHLAIDEHQVLGWALYGNGSLVSFRLDKAEQLATLPFAGEQPISAAAFGLGSDDVALGFADGTVRAGRIRFQTQFLQRDELPAEIQSAALAQQWELTQLDQGILQRTPGGQFRLQQVAAELDAPIDLDESGSAGVKRLDYVVPPNGPVIAALTGDGILRLVSVRKRKNMLTGKETATLSRGTLSVEKAGRGLPDHLMLAGLGENVLLLWNDGHLARYETRGLAQITLVEEIDLLAEPDVSLTAATFLLGRNTLVTGDSTGRVRAWFRTLPEALSQYDNRSQEGPPPADKVLDVEAGRDRLVCAHDFRPLGVAVTSLTPSTRTRIVAIGLADGRVRLVHVTSQKQLGEVLLETGAPVTTMALAPDDDGLAALAAERLEQWHIDARYPEVTLGTLFWPVWYEGYSRPMHLWQSSSGSQSYEPKFGLQPLIFGTLKATFYSMLFGAPLALLSAIFTSEFLDPRIKSKIKPTIELMASLPSVVLGFLAALVFAPFLAGYVPEVLSSLVTVPLAFLAGAHLWQLLPYQLSLRLARFRFLFILAMLPVGIFAAVMLGPWMEAWLFAGDIKLWLDGQRGTATGGWMLLFLPLFALGSMVLGREVNTFLRTRTHRWSRLQSALFGLAKFVAGVFLMLLGAWLCSAFLGAIGWDPRGTYVGTYDQRNALLVGVGIGFAIIPLIYTIAEDALSSVPQHLRSASLGAGATPWQTTTRIVIPIAASGLFTALMIGLGRAVGETMIVLMAAGNVPVTEWNMFNGLRSLSANIAGELPEAPEGSTHYRTLFVAALCLFLITFAVNTVAELVRQRFRRRAHEL